MPDDAAVRVRHEADAQRFLTRVDGMDAHLDYRRSGDTVTIVHTIVPAAIGGRGIGARLVESALDFVRAQGLKVVPQCSYAAAHIAKHPEHAGLVA